MANIVNLPFADIPGGGYAFGIHPVKATQYRRTDSDYLETYGVVLQFAEKHESET
jgi:hypothetical protein